jgi:hypothetical protein
MYKFHVKGNEQRITVAERLQPLIVIVTDERDRPAKNVRVEFSMSVSGKDAEGRITEHSTRTSKKGVATAVLEQSRGHFRVTCAIGPKPEGTNAPDRRQVAVFVGSIYDPKTRIDTAKPRASCPPPGLDDITPKPPETEPSTMVTSPNFVGPPAPVTRHACAVSPARPPARKSMTILPPNPAAMESIASRRKKLAEGPMVFGQLVAQMVKEAPKPPPPIPTEEVPMALSQRPTVPYPEVLPPVIVETELALAAITPPPVPVHVLPKRNAVPVRTAMPFGYGKYAKASAIAIFVLGLLAEAAMFATDCSAPTRTPTQNVPLQFR